jgi:hypothetical protein
VSASENAFIHSIICHDTRKECTAGAATIREEEEEEEEDEDELAC